MSLSHRVSDGGEITEEETAALQKLSAYAGSMTVRLAEMEAGLNTGALSFGEVSRRLQEDDPGGSRCARFAAELPGNGGGAGGLSHHDL